jgi:sugar/nucleoside kinase (ribokinase family)
MTKKYDVYGMGNAIVDIVAEIDFDFLKEHDVEKGLMTLVEEERQDELLSALDLKSINLQGGGSAANSITALSQFGGQAFYSCKVSNDKFGKFFLEDLLHHGIDTNLSIGSLDNGSTGKCLVMVSPDADRTMNTFLGITTTYSVQEMDRNALLNSKFLYIEGYLVSSPSGKEAMIRAKKVAEENGISTSLTFSDPSMVKYFRDGMIEVVGQGIDLLFCNEEEAMLFTDTNDLKTAREELKKVARKFAITQGPNGAIIFDGDTFIDIEPYPVKAVDTNGAGDMFSGAFLYAINHEHSFAEAGKLASLASSKVVSKIGPRLKRNEAQELLHQLTHG